MTLVLLSDESSQQANRPRGAGPLSKNCQRAPEPRANSNEFRKPACAHYSTARDLAARARVALDDPLFAQIVRTDHWTVGFWYDESVRQWPHPMLYNTSGVIREASDEYFDGAYGVKTGHRTRPAPTRRAGSA